ncbi:alpha-1,6-mannosyltransferase subunit [Coccidioides immitis RS]|uniref:Alpha-1,6-mannosyltransferase subunit n=1 Tax=Coccidioides immitis (strain RS) TaxID=246410 RepID=J3KJ83_COCIM|nr:alpha-1,6-mannosyltransferase subunit [Coccidioides immitis RS]EAS36092.3 alpha-1,6-mannosyltransferase subunit [Coccidioides immitis RS]TPX25746.1 alpha-1,6-mannosyltransferase [Coccidioides immitis]
MSLSRSPSPRPDGGWSSPGLTTGTGGSGTSTPRKGYSDLQSGGGLYMKGIGAAGPGGVSWAAAKAKSDQVRGYPSFSTRNNGFFSRQRRKISASLPRFRMNSAYGEKEKLGRGRWSPNGGPLLSRLKTLLGNLLRRKRVQLLLLLILMFVFWLVFSQPIYEAYRRSSLGGGKKIVLIVASNLGGGVMEWKGAREWAIERDSLRNKRRYVKRWGYDLEIVNMVTKKRYAHEWRESWEKVDTIRSALRKYPKAEWFWWLDLHTFIMEPSLSVENHILKNLGKKTYRNINTYNPLNITHPPSLFYLDPLSLSVEGDGKESSINMLVPQDCSGFNLGSFMVRRSAWTDRLLDIWWDPVLYEQKHMEWEHKEQDSLEHLYTHQPWIRPHVAFVPQRRMNSFPPGACGDGTNLGIHYQEKNRDFLVNMAGCEWGRDCWSEMYHYRQLSNRLNRNPWEKFKDGISERWKKTFGKKKEEKKKT